MPPPDEQRLDSWKEIAAYLRRDITTVQRWERREGMPVRRHQHDKLGSVYAFRSELDDWTRSRHASASVGRGGGEEPDSPDAGVPSGGVDPIATAPARVTPRRPTSIWLVAGGAIVITCVAAWWAVGRASWENPLSGASFQNVTNLGGAAPAAAISRDGKFVAFLSDRGGRMDVWLWQVGGGQFYNLTQGRVPELVNPSVRMLGFSPDGTLVTFWARGLDADAKTISTWAVPILGGAPRPYLDGAAEIDWSSDGSRVVYHTPGPGDPTFVKTSDQPTSAGPIFAAPAGLHAHFPTWSPKDAFVYFVEGSVPSVMDVWRIRPAGGAAERITFVNSQVSHPVLIDDRTLLYLATDQDGEGPWMYGVDVERRAVHRVSAGLDRYTSLAATADGRRLVATLATSTRTLWRLSLAASPGVAVAPTPIASPTSSGFFPRLGPGYLLYVLSTPVNDVIWKLANGAATELWSAPDARLIGGADIAADGKAIVFSVRQAGKTRLVVIDADGTKARVLTESLSLAGAPAWSPDGQSIVSAARVDGAPRLFRISLDGTLSPFSHEYATDPSWSPDGRTVVYSGADIGTTFPIEASTATGERLEIPHTVLSRGGRRLRFLDAHTLVVLRGDLQHRDLWRIDLETGAERQLTKLPSDFQVRDFDLSPDAKEVVLERVEDHSDVVLINLISRIHEP